MTTSTIRTALVTTLCLAAFGAAQAQEQTVYLGGAYIKVDSQSPALKGGAPLPPPGANIDVDDARTIVFGYKRYFTDHWGVDFALGIPPRHKVYGKDFLKPFGQVASVKQVAPTVFVNYRFGDAGDRLRPFVGVGINYTHFTGGRSTASGEAASGGPTTIKLKDSVGLAAQVGVSYALTKEWSLNASLAMAKVKADQKATTTTREGPIVRTTTIDFNPKVFCVTVGYSF